MVEVFYNKHIGMSLDDYVAQYRGLVFSIMKKYKKTAENSMDDFQDFIQIGFEGLIKSYYKFDPTKFPNKTIKPITFATVLVKNEIANYLRDKYCLIKYPREYVVVWSRMRKMGLEDEKDPEVVAEKIDMDIKYVKAAIRFVNGENPLSFESHVPSGKDTSEDVTLGDTIARFGDFSIVVVNDIMDHLDSLNQEIIALKLKGRTIMEIAEAVGRDKSNVADRLRKIRKQLKEYYALT